MLEYSFKYQWNWALRFVKPYRLQILLYFLLEIISLSLGLLFILLSKRTIDFAISGNLAKMEQSLILAALSIFIGFLVGLYSGWVNERMRALMLARLQSDVVNAQMQSTWGVVKDWHTGDILLRVNTDCQEVVQVIGNAAISSIVTVFRILAATGFLWWMDPVLAMLLLAICPLIVFSKLYFRRFRILNQKLKQAESSFANVVQENLRFRLPIRALNLSTFRSQKVADCQDTILGLKSNVLNFSIISKGLINFVINTGFMVTFAWGVYKLQAGAITFGTLSAFLQLVSRIQGPVLTLMSFVPLFIRFRASLSRLNEILMAEKEEEVEPEYLKEINQLELHELNFRYGDKEVLNKLQATFVKGKPTAVVGASGKGKTTLIRLLLHLLTPSDGEIFICAEEKRLPLSRSHRVNFAYVPQGDKLFTGTIADNLQIAGLPYTEERMREILTTACADFVYDLPDKLDTIIGESAHGLSEGQAQRIAVARALLRDCGIWLFDEVTSSLDLPTAALLTRQLMEAGKDKILIFVTHDMVLADSCSQVIYV